MVILELGHDLKASGFVAVVHGINMPLTNFWLPRYNNWRCGPPDRLGVALVFQLMELFFHPSGSRLLKCFPTKVKCLGLTRDVFSSIIFFLNLCC
jgi:hypothetical protein